MIGCPTFTSHDRNVRWSLGRRITDSINPHLSYEAQQILQVTNYECDALQKLAVESQLPSASVHIYCAPCACAIRTALMICKEQSSDLIRYRVRVDERLFASCCSQEMVIDTLSTLLDTIQIIEVGKGNENLEAQLIEYLDRVWIEKRLYEIETRPILHPSQRCASRSIGELLAATKSNYSVYLGVLGDLRQVMDGELLPRPPRPVRVNEIYRMNKYTQNSPWSREFLGTFTPRNIDI